MTYAIENFAVQVEDPDSSLGTSKYLAVALYSSGFQRLYTHQPAVGIHVVE